MYTNQKLQNVSNHVRNSNRIQKRTDGIEVETLPKVLHSMAHFSFFILMLCMCFGQGKSDVRLVFFDEKQWKRDRMERGAFDQHSTLIETFGLPILHLLRVVFNVRVFVCVCVVKSV